MKIENIKFKAKRLDNEEWVCGYFYEENGNTYIIEDRQKDSALNRNEAVLIDPYTVCQFTGARDRYGTSIYEHDLLRSEKTDSTYEVVWNQGISSFSLINTEVPVLYPTNTKGRMLHNRRLKVIGNKFDKEK